jgi:nucleoside-diphosphate-sugar epimerase
MSGKSIFLAGASGFIGQNVLENFNDSEFTVFFNKSKISPRNNIIRETTSIDNSIDSEVWINLAGKAHDMSRVQSEKPYWEANYDFALQLYNQFLESKEARVFIHMSSIKAVADDPLEPIDELTKEDPKTVYGKSKLEADRYIMKNLPVDGKKVYILRPAMVHGKGNKGNLNSLYKYCQSSLPYILGNFNGNRSYLSLENLLMVFSSLIDGIPDSGIYCLSDEDTVASNDLVEIIYSELGKTPSIWHMPKFMLSLLAFAGEFLPIPIDNDTLKKVGSDYVVNSNKIRASLINGFPVKAIDGLKKTIRSFGDKTN